MRRTLSATSIVFALAMCVSGISHAQWVSTKGIPGHSVVGVAVLPGDGGNQILIAVVSADRGGAYRSTDNGNSWQPEFQGLVGGYASQVLAIGNVAFITDDSGLFRSTNGGVNWTLVASPATGIGHLTVRGTELLAVSQYLPYSSTDSGASWRAVNLPLLTGSIETEAIAASSNDLNQVDDQNIYGVGWNVNRGRQTIIRTSDNGATWNVMDSACLFGSIRSLYAHLDARSGITQLFAVTDTSGIMRSLDSGRTWAPANAGLPRVTGCCWIESLFAHGSNLFAITQAGLFISTDNGANWTQQTTGIPESGVQAMAANGATLIAGTNDGVFLSTDTGASWSAINPGLANPPVLGFLATDSYLFAGGDAGIFRSTDNGDHWTLGFPKFAGSVNSLFMHATATGTSLFSSTGWSGQVLRSTDTGSSWSAVFNQEVYHTSGFAALDSTIYVGTTTGVYFSSDDGASWIQPDPVLYMGNVLTLATQGETLLAGTQGRGVFVSRDRGTTWTQRDTIPQPYVNSLVVSGSTIFAGTNQGVFVSSDGMSWVARNAGLTDTINALVTRGNALFAATEHKGIFLSTDDGVNWQPVNDGLPVAPINALTISGSDLFAGTTGAAIWHRPFQEMVGASVGHDPAQTSSMSLSAYPNPLHHSTRISFTLQHSGLVTISIYNTLGVKVSTIYSGSMTAGPHDFSWIPEGLDDGAYQCVVKSDRLRESVPVVIER